MANKSDDILSPIVIYDCKCLKISYGTIVIVSTMTLFLLVSFGFIIGGTIESNLPIFILGIFMAMLLVIAIIYLAIWNNCYRNKN